MIDMPVLVTPAAAAKMVADLAELAEPVDALRIRCYIVYVNIFMHITMNFAPGPEEVYLVIPLPSDRLLVIDPLSVELLRGVVIQLEPIFGDPEGRPGFFFDGLLDD